MYEKREDQQAWLESLIQELEGVAGTVHIQRDSDLYLTAAHNIPPQVVAAVTHVPHGKGMAGAAQTRKIPVQTCNLQTDSGRDIKPGAKAVNALAAIAAPVLDRDGEVRAVVGIAWNKEGEIGLAEELSLMKRIANLPQ